MRWHRCYADQIARFKAATDKSLDTRRTRRYLFCRTAKFQTFLKHRLHGYLGTKNPAEDRFWQYSSDKQYLRYFSWLLSTQITPSCYQLEFYTVLCLQGKYIRWPWRSLFTSVLSLQLQSRITYYSSNLCRTYVSR